LQEVSMSAGTAAPWNACLVCQDAAGCASRRACDRNKDKLDKCDDGLPCGSSTTGCWLREDGSGGCWRRRPTGAKEGPRCDKCGAEMTTALMAAFCPAKRKCEFWTPELDTFLAELMQKQPEAQNGDIK
jgi:hypothetical protein